MTLKNTTKWSLIAGGLIAVLLACYPGFSGRFFFKENFGSQKNRVIVKNESGVPVSQVHLSVESLDGEGFGWDLGVIPPGKSRTIRHRLNDSRAVLVFWIHEKKRTHTKPYIDLWTGEGWIFQIQPSGGVAEGYDYPGTAP